MIIDFGSTGYTGEEPIVGRCFQDLQDDQQSACNLTNPWFAPADFSRAQYLDLLGIEYPQGFGFHDIDAISEDGRVLVGYGTFPFVNNYAEKGFVVRLDSVQCNDRVDNDADGFVDYPDDLGCGSELDDHEAPSPSCGLGGLETVAVLALAMWLRP